MSLPLAFHPDVQNEVNDAHEWYERQRPGLGADFLRALDEVFLRLSATPQVHAMIYQNVRRALPRRFPYGVYYRMLAGRVEVIAVQHSRRDPSSWQSRI
jgi:plasmid stabilization system protein ParE